MGRVGRTGAAGTRQPDTLAGRTTPTDQPDARAGHTTRADQPDAPPGDRPGPAAAYAAATVVTIQARTRASSRHRS